MMLVCTTVVLLFVLLTKWYSKQRFKAQHSTPTPSVSNNFLEILQKLQISHLKKKSLDGYFKLTTAICYISGKARLTNHGFNKFNKNWGWRGRAALFYSRTLQVSFFNTGINYRQLCLYCNVIFLTRIRKHWARSKTRKTWKFFSEIFKSEFSILAIGQNWKLGNKKTRNNISEISKISEVSKFSICHFSFFKKLFFSIFYSRQFRTFYLCYVCLQSLLKCFFLHQNICSNYYLVVIRYIFCEMYLHS